MVIKGFGAEPIMLLTNVEVKRSRRSLWFILQAYVARWLVEETIRFIKQSYRLENMRMLHYQRLRNMTALVLAAAYFSARWLGESTRLRILTAHVARVSKRLLGVPEFHYYALADGIARLLRYASLPASSSSRSPPQESDPQLLLRLIT